MKSIRFSASEEWTVDQLQTLLHSLNVAYNRLYVLQNVAPNSRGKLDTLLVGSLSRVPRDSFLSIESLEINSPAKVSLKGGDKIVEQLREFVRDLWFQNKLEKQRQQQRLENQAALDAQEVEKQKALDELELQERREVLIQERIRTMRLAGFDDERIQIAMRRIEQPLAEVIEVMEEQGVELIEESTDA